MTNYTVLNRIRSLPLPLLSLGFFCFLLLMTLQFAFDGGMEGDMAEYLQNPLRILAGQLPYRDFWLIFPPAEVYLPVIIYKIFGLNLIPQIIVNALIMTGIGVVAFLLLHYLTKKPFISLLGGLLMYFYAIAHPYMLFLLFAAWGYFHWLKTATLKWLLLSATVTSIALLFRIFETGPFVITALVILLGKCVRDKVTLKKTLIILVTFSLPFITTLGVVALGFRQILPTMVYYLFYESLTHGTSMNLPYFISAITKFREFWYFINLTSTTSILKAIWLFGIANRNLLLYLLPILVSLSTIYLLVKSRVKMAVELPVIFLLVWGILTFPKALGRADLGHLAPAGGVFVFLLSLLRAQNLRKKGNSRLITNTVNITFIALSLSLVLTISDRIKTHIASQYPVETTIGIIRVNNKSQQATLIALLKDIQSLTEPKEAIFVTPWYAPPLYLLSNRQNATYYDSLIDPIGLPTQQKQRLLCAQITESKTKVVIHTPTWGFGGDLSFAKRLPLVQQCIDQHFSVVNKYQDYWVYIRYD